MGNLKKNVIDGTVSSIGNKGILEKSMDVDVFGFISGSGMLNITANVVADIDGSSTSKTIANPNIILALFDDLSKARQVGSVDGALGVTDIDNKLSATLSVNITEQKIYYLRVAGTGYLDGSYGQPDNIDQDQGYVGYGSLGQYFLSGNVPPPFFYSRVGLYALMKFVRKINCT